MEKLYLIVIQLIVSIIGIEFFSLEYGIVFSIIFMILIGSILGEKSLLFYVLPIIFFIRICTVVENKEINIDKEIKIQTRIYEGRGEILKVNGKYLSKKEYVRVEKVQDGNYEIEGVIEKISVKKYYKEYFFKIKNIERLKENYFEKKLKKFINEKNKNFSFGEKNLFNAVILGEREGIFYSIKNLFLKSGLMHLLAISGLHMGILVGGLKKFTKKLPIKREIRCGIILLVLTLYFISIRVTPSVQRAYIMAMIYIVGDLIYENNSIIKAWCVSFIISLLINPVIYKDVSFVMSYWAIMAIAIGVPILNRMNIKNKIFNYFIFSFYIQVTMVPLIYMYFGKVSFATIILSMLLTPLGVLYITLCFVSLLFPVSQLVTLSYNILIYAMELGVSIFY